MATVSFDEKVVITDPETVAKMKKDLDDPTPVVLKNRSKGSVKCSSKQMDENVRSWMKARNLK